jgi:hypothetical protein
MGQTNAKKDNNLLSGKWYNFSMIASDAVILAEFRW